MGRESGGITMWQPLQYIIILIRLSHWIPVFSDVCLHLFQRQRHYSVNASIVFRTSPNVATRGRKRRTRRGWHWQVKVSELCVKPLGMPSGMLEFCRYCGKPNALNFFGWLESNPQEWWWFGDGVLSGVPHYSVYQCPISMAHSWFTIANC